ncbi:MAG TPA: flagellar hook assembly protein FlgD [Dongiaceae bacterium]|jgi:flagellar basal-body rod modification protein FlgD|nr:flagellar hook assembly protein FlgD [Dongiaceae bacterium]
MSIFPTSNPASFTGAAATGKDVAKQYNDFLLLLTKQLQSQDPLSPLDTNQFTQQLVAFTNVEQQLQTNQRLDRLIGLQTATASYGAVSLIGKQVAYDGNGISLNNRRAAFDYSLGTDQASALVTIRDANGRAVAVRACSPAAGTHQFVWDGTDTNGQPLPDGAYTATVTTSDTKGATQDAAVIGIAQVSGVKIEDGQVMVFLGNQSVPLSAIKQIGN